MTFKVTFAQPYPMAMVLFGLDGAFFAPRHYLEQFHGTYNENADQVAADAGYDGWAGYFDFMSAGQVGDTQNNPDLPVLKSGEADGGYTTLLLPAGQGAMNTYGFNITTNDPVLREIHWF